MNKFKTAKNYKFYQFLANTYAPLQAPQDAIDKHKYIKDVNRLLFFTFIEDLVKFLKIIITLPFSMLPVTIYFRRTFAGMLYKLDESVGIVVEALKETS